jgi:hypothetical protein
MDTLQNLIYIYSKKNTVYELIFDLVYFNGNTISSTLLKNDDLLKFNELIKQDKFDFNKSYNNLSNDITFNMQYYLSKPFNNINEQFGGSIAVFDDKTKFDIKQFDKLINMDSTSENVSEIYVNKTYKYIFYLEYDADILEKLNIDKKIISLKDDILECFTKFENQSDLETKIGKIISLELFKENYEKIKKIHKEQQIYKEQFRKNRLIIENYKNSNIYMLNITISKDNNIIIDRDFEFETEDDCKLYGKIAYIIYNLIKK